jgi:hypothetical protein
VEQTLKKRRGGGKMSEKEDQKDGENVRKVRDGNKIFHTI